MAIPFPNSLTVRYLYFLFCGSWKLKVIFNLGVVDGNLAFTSNQERSSCSIDYKFPTELEYEYCNNGHPSTYEDCRSSCQAMDTKHKTGWDLAVIPTEYHNQLIIDRLTQDYPGEKKDDKFKFIWIGLVWVYTNIPEFQVKSSKTILFETLSC